LFEIRKKGARIIGIDFSEASGLDRHVFKMVNALAGGDAIWRK
jgi:hypothetical protein